MRLKELFGIKLKQIRESRGYTQQRLAELCDLNTATIGMFEIGKRTPSFSTIELIAETLKIPASELFDAKDYYIHEQSKDKLKVRLNKLIEDCDKTILKYIIDNVILVKKSFSKKKKGKKQNNNKAC